jgi:hypothetical protein
MFSINKTKEISHFLFQEENLILTIQKNEIKFSVKL